MTMTTTKVQLAINVPQTVQVRYVDVWPGKPYQGQMLPPSVAIKGTFDGVEGVYYAKGPAWKMLKALAAGGVTGPAPEIPDDLAEKVNVPVLFKGAFTLCLQQNPGDKYAEYVITGTSAAPKAAPIPAPAPRPAAPTKGTGASPTVDGGAALNAYDALLKDTAATMSVISKQTGVPVTMEAVQAAAFSKFKFLLERGLLPAPADPMTQPLPASVTAATTDDLPFNAGVR